MSHVTVRIWRDPLSDGFAYSYTTPAGTPMSGGMRGNADKVQRELTDRLAAEGHDAIFVLGRMVSVFVDDDGRVDAVCDSCGGYRYTLFPSDGQDAPGHRRPCVPCGGTGRRREDLPRPWSSFAPDPDTEALVARFHDDVEGSRR